MPKPTRSPKPPKPHIPKRISPEEVDQMIALLNYWCSQEHPDAPRQPGSGLIH